MTIYKCPCGSAHDSRDPRCTFAILLATPTPESVGAAMRVMLYSLRAPGHSQAEEEDEKLNSYATDALRRRALDFAGFCWSTPGEMAPRCHCDWSTDDPSGPRKGLHARLADLLEQAGDIEGARWSRNHNQDD